MGKYVVTYRGDKGDEGFLVTAPNEAEARTVAIGLAQLRGAHMNSLSHNLFEVRPADAIDERFGKYKRN